MTNLLCLFTQEAIANDGTYAYVLIAAPDMVAAQHIAAIGLKGSHWGPCKIIKGARISGVSRIVVTMNKGVCHEATGRDTALPDSDADANGRFIRV